MSLDTDNSLITIKGLDKKTSKGGSGTGQVGTGGSRPAPVYTINYYSSKFLRGSGGRLTEEEVQIGDTIKTIVSDRDGRGNLAPTYMAKRLTDLSIRYTKIQGSMGDVSDTEDVFILSTKRGDITVNLEDNTDTIHKPIKQQNNPLTKANAIGYFNSNTMKMYGTKSVTMWSR